MSSCGDADEEEKWLLYYYTGIDNKIFIIFYSTAPQGEFRI